MHFEFVVEVLFGRNEVRGKVNCEHEVLNEQDRYSDDGGSCEVDNIWCTAEIANVVAADTEKGRSAWKMRFWSRR